MTNSQRLRDHIDSLGLEQATVTDLRNGFWEIRWISARSNGRVYHRSVCARSIGGAIASLSRAVR